MTQPHSKKPQDQQASLGIAGRLAASFQDSALTPLLAIVALLLGFFAIAITPKEEEPQIDVTFANVFIAYPGASAKEVEQLIAIPAQQVLSELAGIDQLFSISSPGQVVLTIAFEVGIPRQEAIVNLYNQVESHADWFPAGLNIPKPIIKPMGIDDVPIMALTLSNKILANTTLIEGSNQLDHEALTRIAHSLETELKTIAGTRDIYTIGQHNSILSIELDANKMNGHNITFADISERLQAANSGGQLSSIIQNNQIIKLQAGNFLASKEDVESLIIGRSDEGILYLADIATISQQADIANNYVFIKTPSQPEASPAVTIAIAKQPGTNAVDITKAISERLSQLENRLIPDSVLITESRNYGATAESKANKLMSKLLFATFAVVLLVLATMSWREAIIVGSAIFITLALTLFASWVWGFTLNRISLFALIFSIGILVDDAIVVMESIHRHMHSEDGKKIPSFSLIPKAVDEVGSPTILATFTVIAALMPMAFVTGLMGPYMSPIPINASTGMLISLLVAFIVTPWLALKLLRHTPIAATAESLATSESLVTSESNTAAANTKLEDNKSYQFFQRLMLPFIRGEKARRNRHGLMLGTLILIMLAMALPIFKIVVMKMLPFDNKSELQIIVDMPEGTTLEQTLRVLDELSDHVITLPEVKDVQLYAGSAAPINFNGLIRQYYLRQAPHHGDLQINLVDKSKRDVQSHDLALSLRQPLQTIGKRFGANVKIVEVPPGPPVTAAISAEVYGLSYEQQLAAAQQLADVFQQADSVVDIDTSIDAPQQQWNLVIQRNRAMLLGLSEKTINQAITTATSGWDIGYLHSEQQKYALPMRLRLNPNYRNQLQQLLILKVRSQTGELIALSEVIKLEQSQIEQTIYHKDQRPVVFVTADMAGPLDSPLYGMFDISGCLNETQSNWQQKFVAEPSTPATAQGIEIKWDGEWQITYETFRDMGIAYGFGMILIYLLVVAQFRSYSIPLVIMAPIPLTLIGVMPGHALLDAQFTATSMIGMIALAGIIVRNSILLVDFMNQQLAQGLTLEQAVIQSAAVRAKPIILTGAAAMTGAFFILDDPIFNGLAISLIFGILVSSLMTLILIPLLFFILKRPKLNQADI